MNAAGRDVLVAAALAGVPQIRGAYRDHDGGMCALGVLIDSMPGMDWYGWRSFGSMAMMAQDRAYTALLMALAQYGLDLTRAFVCDLCVGFGYYKTELDIIQHWNDDHCLSFLDIARKLPDTEVPA